MEVLARKKNIRLLVTSEPQLGGTEFRQISGGLLLQRRDALDAPGDDPVNWTLATGSPADPETLADLKFAWRTCRAVKSNAIVVAKAGATVGVGMGQVNRVDAARLAVEHGGDRVRGAVAASDAFFPFPDGLETLTDAGVKAIVDPGGSMRDDVVAEAAATGITLYLTGPGTSRAESAVRPRRDGVDTVCGVPCSTDPSQLRSREVRCDDLGRAARASDRPTQLSQILGMGELRWKLTVCPRAMSEHWAGHHAIERTAYTGYRRRPTSKASLRHNSKCW